MIKFIRTCTSCGANFFDMASYLQHKRDSQRYKGCGNIPQPVIEPELVAEPVKEEQNPPTEKKKPGPKPKKKNDDENVIN